MTPPPPDDQDPASLFSMAADDTVRLTTVGIDIGSATSQLNFSRLELQRLDGRYEVSRRDLVFESEVILTPYTDSVTIDTGGLGAFIEAQYAAAGLGHDDVDSGALILTGLALAKRNSQAIGEIFAAEAGKLVAVSAGDVLEATFAGRGAGGDRRSAELGKPVAHIDVGGGTTKYALFSGGRLDRVAAIDVGARLVLFGASGEVTRVEPPARRMAAGLGLELTVGGRPGPGVIDALAGHMAGQVLAHAGVVPHADPDPGLLRTEPLAPGGGRTAAAISFSGGVSEYVYGREERSFGDLGRPLAAALVRLAARAGAELLPVPRGIRATVLGAAQYSLQLSGNTVYASTPSMVPLRNVPVVSPRLSLTAGDLDPAGLATVIGRALSLSEPFARGETVAIALHWSGSATYRRLLALAGALLTATGAAGRASPPLVAVFDSDIGGLVGEHIVALGATAPVLVLDGIDVSDLDFLDIGAFIPGTGALPVVVKSLLFPNLPAVAGTEQATAGIPVN
ncbi:MAG TPA: ethanolamine ammonia-lyase reactivating factor EutA [Streptosporangiaceae bacterium]|jgi:ethanolamine utilization protein EutA